MTTGPYLAGATFSLADIGIIPYVLRLEPGALAALGPLSGGRRVWQRVRNRPSVEQTMKRMTEGDLGAFKSIQADPWLKVRDMLAA